MDHWAYFTDDDEQPKKETVRDATQTQYTEDVERTSACFWKPHPTVAAAITNAPEDPSWANLKPHPENARPPPTMDPPAKPFRFAPPGKAKATEELSDEDDYRNPSWPPGVIDISGSLRRRHRERQKEADWAQQLLVRFGLASAGTQSQPASREEPLPWNDAREETTRNGARKGYSPLPSTIAHVGGRAVTNGNEIAPDQSSADSQSQHRRREEALPWYSTREETTRNGVRKSHGPLPSTIPNVRRRAAPYDNASAPWHMRQPSSSEHPSDGLAGPHMGSTRHRGGGGPCHHPRKGRPHAGSAKPNHPGRSSESRQGYSYHYNHGWNERSWHGFGSPWSRTHARTFSQFTSRWE